MTCTIAKGTRVTLEVSKSGTMLMKKTFYHCLLDLNGMDG